MTTRFVSYAWAKEKSGTFGFGNAEFTGPPVADYSVIEEWRKAIEDKADDGRNVVILSWQEYDDG